jgi:hypothetical protein
MPLRAAGPFPITGVAMPTWLVRFDEAGQCMSPATADALVHHLADAHYSDVIFHSHGWNTDFSDALDQYGRFLRAFEAVLTSFPLPGFRPIFVGVTWPSVWLAEDPGPSIAAVASGPSAALASLIERLAGPMNLGEKSRFYALSDAAALDRDGALDLARLVAPQIGRFADDSDGRPGSVPNPEDVVAIAMALAPPDTTAAVGPVPVASALGLADAINPRNILRLLSLYQMKDRAGTVGTNGVADLLRRIIGASGAGMRVCGHSFGAKVMLSALCAPAPLPRRVDSLLLLQPAISHLAMAEMVPGPGVPGGYRAALDRVAGPIFTTYSALDQPLHDVFHLALRRAADLGEAKIAGAGEPPNQFAALGGYGPRLSSECLLNTIPEPGAAFDIGDARLVGLDGSEGRIKGHGDVTNPYTAWALRRLIASA